MVGSVTILPRASSWSGVAVEWLPAYAPELDPVEQVWGRTKYAVPANFIHDDVGHLAGEVSNSIKHPASDPMLLRSFRAQAEFVL